MSTHRAHEQGPGLSAAFGGVTAVLALLFLAQGAWAWLSPEAGGSTLVRNALFVVSIGALGTLAWNRRRVLYGFLISVPFAVAILTVLMLATALGTVVLQGGPAEEYAHRYGSLAPAMLALGLDDLFHAPWFTGLLGLLVLSVILVGTRRAVWRVAMVGHMFCHLGIAVILLGGLVGKLFGLRGVIDIHEGQAVPTVLLTERGIPTGERRPLGFALRLEDFEIERHEPDYRLHVYRRYEAGYRLASSFRAEEAADWTPVDGAGTELRVLDVYPDFQVLRELVPADPEEGGPALEVDLLRSDGVVELRLLAGVPGRQRVEVDEEGNVLGLLAEPPGAAEIAELGRREPARHVVVVADAEGRTQEVEVVLGETTRLPTGDLVRAIEFLPDFVYDTASGRAENRSQEPRNPALRVAIASGGQPTEAERWLFGNMPGYDEAHAGAGAGGLTYRYEPGIEPPPSETLVIASQRELWRLEHGQVVARTALSDTVDELPGVPAAGYRFYESAVEVEELSSRSEDWNNPVVELELRQGAEASRTFLSATHSEPVWLPDGESLLAFEPRSDDVRAYRSTLAVLEKGEVVREKTIEVNDPLTHRGFVFYQSSYRAEDPTYSGLLVVKDPGYPVVLAGFLMISLGVIFIYYVRPRIFRWGL